MPEPSREEQLKEISKQMPVEAVRALETFLKGEFERVGIPYSIDTLKASRVAIDFCIGGVPPVASQPLIQTALLFVRLIDEQETGMIASPIKPLQ